MSAKISEPSTLPVIQSVPSMRRFCSDLPAPVALVPTMGMLHRGHMALIRLAAQQAPSVIVSVYVNPTQLAPAEQESYPSTLEPDVHALQGVDEELRRQKGRGRIVAIFAPTDKEMYPYSADLANGRCSHVAVSALLTGRLEGRDQPGHFIGVATVCLKLFNVVRPQIVVLGEKDYQQTVIVRRLVEELLLDVEVAVAETVREMDGLALSSRNVYLGGRRREVAAVLWRALQAAAQVYQGGECRRKEILKACIKVASEEGDSQSQTAECDGVRFKVLYFGLSDCVTLEDVETVDRAKGALLSGAIQVLPLETSNSWGDGEPWNGQKSVRLIDSIVLTPKSTMEGL